MVLIPNFTPMKNLWIAALILLVQCTSADNKSDTFTRDESSDTTTLLAQYWILSDADNPMGRDLVAKEDGRDFMPGLVVLQNGEIVENPAGEMTRGNYERVNDSMHVTFVGGRAAYYKITMLSPDTLRLDRVVNDELSTLYYGPTNTWWPEADVNPFSQKNMAWTVKPSAPESREQIKQRVDDYIRFCQYYIEGYSRGGATRISFVGLPNIFNFYAGGITIPNDDKNLNKKWVDCFYDRTQAVEAYNILRGLVIKKYDWDQDEPNWINQSGPVLQAMRDSLGG